MRRTRTAILDAAEERIADGGIKFTMSQLAVDAGVAKGTLYNHFRTKDDVLIALAQARVATLVDECAAIARDRGPVAALSHAAGAVANRPALRKLRDEQPALVARLAGSLDAVPEQQVATVVGPERVDAVVRWVASHALAPGSDISRTEGARLLVEADSGDSDADGDESGLGWAG